MYCSEVDDSMKRMTRDKLHYLIEHIEIVSSVLCNYTQTMNLKRNFRWKSKAVSQERTFLDNHVVNPMDRKTIVIIIVLRIIGVIKISVA
jgi:hypothetical protein